MTPTVEEAQVRLPELVRGLSAGEVVTLTDDAQAVAKLVAAGRRTATRPSLLKERLTILSEDDDHLDDFAEYLP